MKPIIRLFLLFVFICANISVLSSQTLSAAASLDPTVKDSMVVQIANLPIQPIPVSLKKITPRYRFLYIFGDGGFKMTEEFTDLKHNAQHRYPLPVVTGEISDPTYHARAYGIGIYSNGDRPPKKLKTPSFPSQTQASSDAISINKIVHQDSFLNLMPHAQAKMGEPLVYVLAVHNPLDVTIERAELFLLFGSEIIEVSQSEKGEFVTRKTEQYGQFPIEEVLVHSNNTSSQVPFYQSALPASINGDYKQILAFQVNNLAPDQEEHIFIEFMVDSINFNAFNGKNLGFVKFTSILNLQNEVVDDSIPLLNQQQQLLLAKIKFEEVIDSMAANLPDSVYFYEQNIDSTSLSQQGDNGMVSSFGRLVAMNNHTVALVKEHDPNFLKAVSCACPTNERKKIIITLHAENDGHAPVHDIYFDMELPDGITTKDIVQIPMSHHPFRADLNSIDSISFDSIDEKHLRWHMKGQLIQSIADYGVGDPRTYAEVQFVVFTNVEPSSLDSLLQTCVRFNNIANDPVCTYPVSVTLVTSSDGDFADVLSCSECEQDPNPGETPPIPWWVWLILIILAIILLVYFLRN